MILKRCSHRRCCRSDDNRSRVYVFGDVQAGGPNSGIYSFICHRSLVRKYPPHQRALYNVIAHSLSTLRKKSMRGLWWTAGNSRWTSRYSRKARRRHQRRVRRFLTDFLCMFLWMEEEEGRTRQRPAGGGRSLYNTFVDISVRTGCTNGRLLCTQCTLPLRTRTLTCCFWGEGVLLSFVRARALGPGTWDLSFMRSSQAFCLDLLVCAESEPLRIARFCLFEF